MAEVKTFFVLIYIWLGDVGKISSHGVNLLALVISSKNNLDCEDDIKLIVVWYI